jgi:signal transduction histidine kinase
MENPRWWNVAVLAMAAVATVVTLTSGIPSWRQVGAEAALATFVLAWFLIGRRALLQQRAAILLIGIVIITASIATGFFPAMAILQCVGYPLIWVAFDRVRTAVIANVLLALGVGTGYAIGSQSLLAPLTTAGLSLAFSVALGLWITSIAVQSESRRALLAELQDAQAQLAAAHRDAGVMSERERLAREIHDTIAQDLTGLVLLTQRARRELAAGSAANADAQLALVEESARQTLVETRSLVTASAPVGLEAGGLGDALERLGARFSRETSVDVTVDAAASPALDRDSEVVLLRIAQEGLANVRKHSGAGSASIRIESGVDDVSLVVADDGAGFDVAAPSTGFGLAGMRERLALVGGTLDVASSPAGTVLTARLPRARLDSDVGESGSTAHVELGVEA